MSSTGSQDDVNDETPLLQTNGIQQKPTPLPMSQVFIVFLERLSDLTILTSIDPYINQLISELPIVGGDARRVGYYTGIVISLYFAAETVTVLWWNRLSDRIGRKPVFLCGTLATAVCITLFGLSRSFTTLALCRFLNGALNGNIGVAKSILAEITDESNIARGFSMLPLAAGVGQVIGPFVGGVLSRPQDHWPDLFSHNFWSEYPYFLPCLVVAALACFVFIITALFFEETVKRNQAYVPQSGTDGAQQPQGESGIQDTSPKDVEQPLRLRSLLTRPVLTSIANYAVIALLDVAAMVLLPLVWSTPINLGGLGLSPASIGLWTSGYGISSALFQYVVFPPAIARFGPRPVFITGIALFFVIFVLFPLENVVARRATAGGTELAVWPLIVLQLVSISISDMAFGAVFMYVTSAAPNRRSLGATNGLAQTAVSIQRTVGPAAATALFAYSLENNVMGMGGNFAYAVLLLLVFVGLFAAIQLPSKTWRQNDNDG